MSLLGAHRAALAVAVALLTPALVLGARRAPASAATSPARIPPAPAIDAALRAVLARRHAPELRFNAWFADRRPSPMNRNEDYFPMSVDRFLDALVRGEAALAVQRSEGARPALARRVAIGGRAGRPAPAFQDGRLFGYPRGMVGDPPGEAPIYADVYPDRHDPGRAFVEYWAFYPMDACDARVARGVGGLGGHRSDWEHVSLELALDRATGASTIAGAVFYGHGHALAVAPAELELVEGAHPAVYVSQGKHASYPEPGEWRNYQGLEPLVEFDDVFHGNGARVATWRGEVVDIARARADRPEWLAWRGLWGPDDDRILGVRYAASSFGPWFHGESNDRFAGVTGTWANAKATVSGLACDRDRGFAAPRPAAAPVPVRVD